MAVTDSKPLEVRHKATVEHLIDLLDRYQSMLHKVEPEGDYLNGIDRGLDGFRCVLQSQIGMGDTIRSILEMAKVAFNEETAE